jgi:hypothetical protein
MVSFNLMITCVWFKLKGNISSKSLSLTISLGLINRNKWAIKWS